MKKKINILFRGLAMLALISMSTEAMAQCGPITTPSLTNNGQDGVMFDIVALQSVNITQFAMDFDTGNHTIEVYGKAGTHVGFQNNAAAWTLLGTANAWAATTGTNVLIPVTFSQFLCAGDVGAFYITSTTGGCNYSNGAAVGNVVAADANIQVLIGTGKDYPFNTSFQPRTPNVTVYYSCAISCCLPPTMTYVAETCVGSCNGSATATVGAGGISPYTYAWDAAAGNQNTQTATNLCAGTYTVNVTDNTGCVSQGTVTVTSGGASANATITPVGPYCNSDPAITLSAVDPGGAWSGTGITNAATGAFNPSVAGIGTHTITYTIAGPCGDSQTTNIIISAAFNATIAPVGPFCETDPSVTLSAVDPGGTWTGTGITNGAAGTFSPTIAGPGTHTITYTIAGSCGDVQSTNIVVTSALDATITSAGPFCEADAPISLSAADPGGTWSGTGITNGATGIFDPGVAGPGIHTITYTISGSCGDTQTTDIVVNAVADATISPVNVLCELEAAINLSAVDPGGTWSGTGITNAATGTFDPGVSGAGTFTVTYTISGSCGDIATMDIAVTAALDATITQVGPFCTTEPTITLVAVDGGGTWSGNGITNPATGNFNPASAGPGSHTITYTIPGTCGDVQTMDILIYPIESATFSYPTTVFCISDPNPTATITGTPGGTFTITGTGVIDAATGEIDITASGVGGYTVTYTTNGPCPAVSIYDITILIDADASITGVGPLCAYDSPVTIQSLNPGGTWSGPGVNPVTGAFDPTLANIGMNTITYTISGTCGDAQSIQIQVIETPSVNTIYDTTITYGASVNLTTISSASIYDWSPSSWLNCSTCISPVSTPDETITYTITVEEDGCVASDEVTIIVLYDPIVYIPNIFSPNGDNNNDILYVRGKGIVTLRFIVYDRWGEKVFESTSLQEGWDGVFRGKKMNPGVFMYYVDVTYENGFSESKKGDVTLIR